MSSLGSAQATRSRCQALQGRDAGLFTLRSPRGWQVGWHLKCQCLRTKEKEVLLETQKVNLSNAVPSTRELTGNENDQKSLNRSRLLRKIPGIPMYFLQRPCPSTAWAPRTLGQHGSLEGFRGRSAGLWLNNVRQGASQKQPREGSVSQCYFSVVSHIST